ncbi:MAG: hypothetical protein ACQEV7_23205 [Bacillota bacterium]
MKSKDKTNRCYCDGCFCETFKCSGPVSLGALQIGSTVYTLGLQVPPDPAGTRRISSITFLCLDLDTCYATFSIGFTEEPFAEVLYADCQNIYAFSFAPAYSPFPAIPVLP